MRFSGSPGGNGGSSRWRLFTTTSRCWAGRRTRWWYGSGSPRLPSLHQGSYSTTCSSTTRWGDPVRTLVYGLGESGVAATKVLLGRGEEVLAADANDGERLHAVLERSEERR